MSLNKNFVKQHCWSFSFHMYKVLMFTNMVHQLTENARFRCLLMKAENCEDAVFLFKVMDILNYKQTKYTNSLKHIPFKERVKWKSYIENLHSLCNEAL